MTKNQYEHRQEQMEAARCEFHTLYPQHKRMARNREEMCAQMNDWKEFLKSRNLWRITA